VQRGARVCVYVADGTARGDYFSFLPACFLSFSCTSECKEVRKRYLRVASP
jgi:hypothetical protein